MRNRGLPGVVLGANMFVTGFSIVVDAIIGILDEAYLSCPKFQYEVK